MLSRRWKVATTVGLLVLSTITTGLTSAQGYETAEYTVIKSEDQFEVRKYPDLMLVATNSKPDSNGRDGSFMKLFGYISGANEAKQSIAMTTPVFMEGDSKENAGQMGFVMPKRVAVEGIPAPTGLDVAVKKREGGKFAVYRFAGRLNAKLAKESELKLRDWMTSNQLQPLENSVVETAAYDAPYVPGPLRRNEVLIRIKDDANSGETVPAPK